MRIRLAFTDDDSTPDQMPLLIAAVDEYTVDNWGRIPDWYTKDVAKYRNVREATIYVTDGQVQALFAVPAIASSDLKAVER